MAFVFGVANHSPEFVLAAMRKGRVVTNDTKIGIVPTGSVIDRRPRYDVLLFLTPRDIRRNRDVLASSKYLHVSAVLFSDPMNASEISGIIPLDFEPNVEYPGFGFTLKPLNACLMKGKHSQSELQYESGKYLQRIVKYVQSGSLLNPLMTFLYTLPSALQNKIKEEIARWLYLGKPEKQLAQTLKTLGASERVLRRLSEIVFTEIGAKFKAAFERIRTEAKAGIDSDVKKIAKQFQVSDYELRYLISIFTSSRKPDQYTDSFDRAKNRRR